MTTTPRDLHYGQPFAEALRRRPERHFLNRGKEAPLTIGPFGVWGSGGELDLEKAAMQFLTDFRNGALGRISLETPETRRAMLEAVRGAEQPEQ